VPRTITPSSDTEYIIVVTQKVNTNGEAVYQRELLQRGDRSLNTFYCLDNGICPTQYTVLEWD
jgi:hypothetical protein